jgi:hypothetical protein
VFTVVSVAVMYSRATESHSGVAVVIQRCYKNATIELQ